MNIENLRLFVGALKEVAKDIQVVDMASYDEPTCGTPGCHAGLAKLALDLLGVDEAEGEYDYTSEAERLSFYLFGESDCSRFAFPLRQWARENHAIWGNKTGYFMFGSGLAFGMDSERFPSSVIVEHWEKVLERVLAAEDKAIG